MKRLLSILTIKLNNLNLERKLLLILTFVNIIVIGTFSVLGLNLVTERYNQLLYQSMDSSSHLFSRELSNRLNTIITMSNVIRIDNTVQTHLDIIHSGRDYHASDSYTELYTTLQKYYQQYKQRYIPFAAISNDKFTTYTYGYLYDKILAQVKDELTKAAETGRGYPVWVTDNTGLNYLYLVRQIRKIENLALENLGVLTITVNFDELLSEISKTSRDYQNTFWIFYDDDSVIYHSEELSYVQLEDITNTVVTYKVLELDNKKYFAIKGTVNSLDWNFIHLVSYDEVAASQQSALKLYMLMLAVSLIVVFVLMHFILKKITDHIGVLLQKMQVFRGEETYQSKIYYDYSQRKDEIGMLHRQFDSMADEIKRLINNEYRNALLMKDAQIKSLESQINPHFLYNTLETVNWRARAIGERQISKMVESMGSFLRLTLSGKSENFTLKQDLDIVNYYMTIQQIRFDERLNFQIDIPELLFNIQIPKLTLQPLVENAVHYALEEITEECTILITAEHDEETVRIEVKNTGSTFEDDLLDKLKSREIIGRGLGIALLNIQERIRLTFGDPFGIDFYNDQTYAVARVTIPFILTQGNEKGCNYDSYYNC